MRGCRQGIIAWMTTVLLAATAFATEAHVVQEKLRAKFSGKKITVRGKVVASGEWPLLLRVELVDTQENVLASGSDSVRGTASFQIDLLAPAKQRFVRQELAKARVRYWLRRGRKEEEAETIALAEICPNLVKKRRWLW